jgi:hypothetical protein
MRGRNQAALHPDIDSKLHERESSEEGTIALTKIGAKTGLARLRDNQ